MLSLAHFLVLGCLIVLLGACASGNAPAAVNAPRTATPTQLSTATPTPPGVPAGTVLYQSNWSRGLASWGEPPGWKIVKGVAQSDLRAQNALTLPYKLKVSNYAFEFRFQVVKVPVNGGFFILKASRTTGRDGYVAGILGLLDPAPHSEFSNPQIQVYLDPQDAADDPANSYPSDYEPGTFWHTYRIEVQGSQVSFFADGTRKGTATSDQTSLLSNGPLQLISSLAVIRISSIRVLAL